MFISLIIGYYKRLDNLKLIFEGLKNQTYNQFEVIIAEDDDTDLTIEFLEDKKGEVSFRVKHVSQPDTGFRKNKILNKALSAAKGELIVFIDGDCIPHKQFLSQYAKEFELSTILYGRRVMLSQQISRQLFATNNIAKLNLFQLFLSKSSRIEDGFFLPANVITKKKFGGIIGCNWGIAKQSLIEVNGFDEDYEGVGTGEDTDIEWRLLKNGAKTKSMKFKAIVYHLYHEFNHSGRENDNENLMRQKIMTGNFKCINGINKISTAAE